MSSLVLMVLLHSPSLFVMAKKPSPSVQCKDNTDGTNNPAVVYHYSNNELRPYPNRDFWYMNDSYYPNVERRIDCTGIPIGQPYDVQPKTITSEEAYKFMPMFKMRTDMKCQPGPATRQEAGHCRVDRINPPLYYESATVQEFDQSPSTLHSYWVYYGKQDSCGPDGAGKHDHDWEHVDIHVQDGKIKHVTYSQHGGMYTMNKKNVPMQNGRVVVYVGKYSHGSYHDEKKKCSGKLGDLGCKNTWQYCKYWNDPRTGKSYDWFPNKLKTLPGRRLQQDTVPIDDPVCMLETGGKNIGGIEIEPPTNTCKRNPHYLTYPNKHKPMTARDMILGNYRPGSAVKCMNNTDGKNHDRTVYRFENKTLRPYPSPEIFQSWDPHFPRVDYIDCTYFPIGTPMNYNLTPKHEGHSIKCHKGTANGDSSEATVYRWTNGKLRRYPNPLVALSWNLSWNKILKISCRGLPIGDHMQRKPNSPQEGLSIRCGGASHIYRWTNNELRYYPSTGVMGSWTNGNLSSTVAFCSGQKYGKAMTWNTSIIPEGKSLRCSGSVTVYRWENGHLRGYPSRKTFESCDGNWSKIGNIDCRGLSFGPPMSMC